MYWLVSVCIKTICPKKMAKYEITYWYVLVCFALYWYVGHCRRHWNHSVSSSMADQKRACFPEGTCATEPLNQNQGANSSTSTRGPWSGSQIIQYWLSDVWKIKHAVAVMTAGTVRVH